MSGATKHDQSKPPVDLVPYEAIEAVAQVLDFGAKKYARGNWTKGLEYSRLIAAAQRHIGLYNSGQDTDEESGLNHIAHAACCLMFLLYMQKHREDLDDRTFKQGIAKPAKPKKADLLPGRSFRTANGMAVTFNGEVSDWGNPIGSNGFIYQTNNAEGVSIWSNGDEDPHNIVEELP